MAEMGIYQIEINQKCYIGSTVDLKRRLYNHLCKLKNGNHINKHLQSAYNFYGEGCCKTRVLEYVDNASDLIRREQYYIDTINPHYNIRKTAESNRGVPHSAETKERIRNTMIGMNVGKTHTAESREKMKKSHTGIPLSDSNKKNIGDALRGVPKSKEHVEKVRQALKGRTQDINQRLKSCKFNEEQVAEITRLYNNGMIQQHIAKLYGVDNKTIHNVTHKKAIYSIYGEEHKQAKFT